MVVRPSDTLDELKEKVALATILGTFQSTLTDFRYLRKVWKDNAEEERLLGVSLTGIMDHPVLNGSKSMPFVPIGEEIVDVRVWLSELKDIARSTNEYYSELLGISPSKQLTLVKPSGTVSQLCSTASGIHPRYAPYYLRRVTQDNKDPLTQLMIEQGIPNRIGPEKTTFEFPIKSPEGSICARDIGAMKQLELWLVYRENWCDGNPSQTIYYTDKDFLQVQEWVYRHWDKVGGLSFFPIDDFVYDRNLQPYLEISKEEYEKHLKVFPTNIDWSGLVEGEDNTTSSQELACAGGSCEL